MKKYNSGPPALRIIYFQILIANKQKRVINNKSNFFVNHTKERKKLEKLIIITKTIFIIKYNKVTKLSTMRFVFR